MHLRGLLGTLAPAILAGVLVAVPQAAQASIGVGIQPGPVRLSGVAHPGQTVALPSVAVVNPGTQRESIRVVVQRNPRAGGRPVPPSWVRPGVPSVQLAPRHAIRIPLELVVPDGAKPGAYLSDIVAIASGQPSAEGANLGAGAATLLEFRVAPDPAPGFWWSVFTQTLWALLILILLAAVVFAVRRSGLRIRVEREAVSYGTADDYGGGHA
ncbi:MAG: hypothetical protein J2P30_03180 [Actinobacteria bacterium]|nr:hypothetical protein [Actinomycetota bacterium]